MRKLIDFRNKYVRSYVILIVSFLLFLSLSQFTYIKEAINVGHYSNSPKVYSYQELQQALAMNGSAKISIEFLQSTGIFLGLDDQSVVEYTYSYTNFAKHFLIIAQEGSEKHQFEFDKFPREIVIRRTNDHKHYDAYNLVISEFANILEVSKSSIESEFYPYILLLTTMRPHLQFSIYGMGMIAAILAFVIYHLYRNVTHGITTSHHVEYLDLIDQQIDTPVSNTRNILITKDFLVYKKTLDFMKQSIIIEDITIIGIKRWFHKFKVVLCVDAVPYPLKLYLSKTEIFILFETLKMSNIDYIRDDSMSLIESWHLDPYRKN